MNDEKLKLKLLQLIASKEETKADLHEKNDDDGAENEAHLAGKTSYDRIPKFYSKLPEEIDLLPKKLRNDARSLFLLKKSNNLLENKEIQAIWTALEEHQTPPLHKGDKLIGYEDFKKAALLVNHRCRQFFKPSFFAKFLHMTNNNNNSNNSNNNNMDPYGRISIEHFINYVMRKVWLYQTWVSLSLHDSVGLGYLCEKDLENYILELIPFMPQLNGMETSFYCFYTCTAVRKFLFFLDPLRQGRVRIRDILACSFLDDLSQLKSKHMSADEARNNWFSQASAVHIFEHYLSLDTDQNGMLSRQEFSNFNGGTLTTAFLDRIFQECFTYNGEMDYKAYLDLVLATRHPAEEQTIQYLFKFLDTRHRGHLSSFDLHFFYRSVMEQSSPGEQIPFEDVKNEIFDMLKCDHHNITCQDLVNSGHAETIVGMLTDVGKFWKYENREASFSHLNMLDVT